jgi:hypothetical protein
MPTPIIRAPDQTRETKKDIDHHWEVGPSETRQDATDYVVVSIYYIVSRYYCAKVNRQTYPTGGGMLCVPLDAVTLAHSLPAPRFAPKMFKAFADETLRNLAQLFADRTYAKYDKDRKHLDEWLAAILAKEQPAAPPSATEAAPAPAALTQPRLF